MRTLKQQLLLEAAYEDARRKRLAVYKQIEVKLRPRKRNHVPSILLGVAAAIFYMFVQEARAETMPMGKPIFMTEMKVCRTAEDAAIVARERNKSLDKGTAAMSLMVMAKKCTFGNATVTYTGTAWKGEPFKVFTFTLNKQTYYEVSDWDFFTI